jgi:hypothetical protein
MDYTFHTLLLKCFSPANMYFEIRLCDLEGGPRLEVVHVFRPPPPKIPGTA